MTKQNENRITIITGWEKLTSEQVEQQGGKPFMHELYIAPTDDNFVWAKVSTKDECAWYKTSKGTK